MTGRALHFRNQRRIGVFACVIAPLAVMLFGCEAGGLRPTKEFLQAKPGDMEWVKEAKFGWFYSPPDWHHPDYRTDSHHKYIKYMHGQLRELCTNYGKVDIIWFDG